MSQVVGKNKTQKSWSWTTMKNHLRERARVTGVEEGEIWWCAIGENIGVEINGKHSNYERPVLVFSKNSKLGFIGIPLTSQKKKGPWYVHFKQKDKDEYAALSQIRFLSIHRVLRKLGHVDDNDYNRIASGLYNLLFMHNKSISSLATGGLGRENPDHVTSISNQNLNVNDKNISSLTVGVYGRENPKSKAIISNPISLVKRLFQKIFRKTDRKNRKENPKENRKESQKKTKHQKGATNEP